MNTVRLPEDICLLGTGDVITCPGCNGGGPTHIYVKCPDCAGCGQQAGTISSRCAQCSGSGRYNQMKNMKCFGCSGRGSRFPLCRSCRGSGKRLTSTINCGTCDGSGKTQVARGIASHASVEYVHRMADVMAGCCEEEDPEFWERGERLYNVLREVYQFAHRDCPQRVQELFPDHLVVLIRQSWAAVCSKASVDRKEV